MSRRLMLLRALLSQAVWSYFLIRNSGTHAGVHHPLQIVTTKIEKADMLLGLNKFKP